VQATCRSLMSQDLQFQSAPVSMGVAPYCGFTSAPGRSISTNVEELGHHANTEKQRPFLSPLLLLQIGHSSREDAAILEFPTMCRVLCP
jgi:hypothetical protein